MLNHTHQRYNAPSRRAGARRHSRGFSIVELLVGVAIGLFILTGASLLYVNNLGNSRLLLIQARMDQDLRSAMDLITRDLRRGAYWVDSLKGTATTASAATPNTYAAVSVSGSASAATIAYSYDDVSSTTTNLDERTFGFRLTNTNPSFGRIEMDLGNSAGTGNWQAVTDVNIVSITEFSITEEATAIDVSAACTATCTLGAGCPRITVRTYDIRLTGTSRVDPAMVRSLRSQVRVRNDAIAGACS